MRDLRIYFKDFFSHHKSIYFWVFLAIFLGVCIAYNYKVNVDLYLSQTYFRTFWYWPVRFVFLAFPYYFTAVLYAVTCNKISILKNFSFWWKSAFGIMLYSGNYGIRGLDIFLYEQFQNSEHWYFIRKCFMNTTSFLTVFVPILLFYYFFEKDKIHLYGLKGKWNRKLYALFLIPVIPLTIAAATQPDFLRAYPSYKFQTEIVVALDWVKFIIFEICYAFDFVMVELLFRGFLVIGLARVIGVAAIMPMVSAYVFIHFGKPPLETISSFFGGTLLGVLAFYTRNIWGGIILHVGMAWSMEASAITKLLFVRK